MMERSDKYQYDIDNSTGNIAIVNKKAGIFAGYKAEDVMPSHDFSTLETPYAFKLLTQELMAMGLKPTIHTDEDYMCDDDETYEDVEVDPYDGDDE
jgi:DNA-directed RNA polymerase beta subunit